MKKLFALTLCVLMMPTAVLASSIPWNSNTLHQKMPALDHRMPALRFSHTGVRSGTGYSYSPLNNVDRRRIVRALISRSSGGANGWSNVGGNGWRNGGNGWTKVKNVPEPGSLALLGLGLVGLGLARRRLGSKS